MGSIGDVCRYITTMRLNYYKGGNVPSMFSYRALTESQDPMRSDHWKRDNHHKIEDAK